MAAHQLHLDPSGGELLTSAWKELDSKFLSNDMATTAQKMLQAVTPADRLEHILNHPSLYIRASDLILFLENVGIFHLKQHFQLIVEAVFGMGHNSRYPTWALRCLNRQGNPREAHMVLKLLGSTGSLLNLATRLLEDPGFVIEVGMDKLPFALSQRMYQGDIPPYFSSKVCMTDPFLQAAMTSPVIKCLKMNTFEFFFLSFTAHICTFKGTGSISDYLTGWGTMTDNIYNNLLDDYLNYFFPCTGHGVPSDNFRLYFNQVNDSYIAQNLRTQMMNSETSGASSEAGSPRLIKASLLMEQTHPAPRGDSFLRKSQSQKEVWRTETILLLCTEMWMCHAPGNSAYKYSSPASTDQFGKVMLPTVDVVKSIRTLVRHSHFFLNCIAATVMHPMEELKRDVYPTYQKRLYKFLRHLFFNWPMDNSFRIVYETWLSYIQPWRYFHYERIKSSSGAGTKETAEEPVDSRWYGFIQENILFYTKLFNVMLLRMNRMDFATTKNAMMFYRVCKVFTGHEYLKIMLLDIDNVIYSYEQPYYQGQLNGSLSRSPSSPSYSSPLGARFASPSETHKGAAIFRIATLKQIMKDWEQSDFIYEPLFSDNNKKIIYGLIDLARSARKQLQELIDLTEVQQKRDQSWWDILVGTNKTYNAVVGQSINELQKAISQLEVGVSQFATFFEIPLVESSDPSRTPIFTPTKLPRTTFIGSSLDGSSILEGTENRITVLPSGTYSTDMLVPIGNPDFIKARSDECGPLVSLTRFINGILNDRVEFCEYFKQFAGDIMRHYFQKNLKGRFVRAAFAEPVEYFDMERRGRVREKIRKVLPPRINLRFLSSVNFLSIILAVFVVCIFCGLFYGIIPAFMVCWLLFIGVRAITEDEKKLDDLIYLFGDRNYNVDFRGLNEPSTLELG